MKKIQSNVTTFLQLSLASALLLMSIVAHAALPPDFQNDKDLADIVAYVKADHEVLSGLKVIDLSELTVYYGENCRVRFARKVVERKAGWVGPAEPIEFQSKECPQDGTDSVATVPEGKVKSGIIVSAEAGDTACYLVIKDDEGKMHDEMAIFDLCDDTTLINKPAGFSYERSNVMAASCEGNPECVETKVVWLVAQARRI